MRAISTQLIRVINLSPLQIVTGLFFLGGLVSLSGCSLPIYSEAQLKEQSQLQFKKMRSDTPVSTDASVNHYVNCVAKAIIATLSPEDANQKWEVVVFDSEQVNAFAMPGGYIGVFTGILDVAENQHQLAAIIGHEVAHVTERHSLERVNRAATTQIGVMGATVALGGGQGTADLLQMGAQLGLTLPYGRNQESDADIVGVMYMADAGFDPRQSPKLWTNMEKTSESRPPEFMSTHPSPGSRIQELTNLLTKAMPRYSAARKAGNKPTCR